MKKLLVFLTLIVVLVGCGSGDDLSDLFKEIKNTEYVDVTIKGTASFDIPDKFTANQIEAELIEKASNVQYFMNYKQIPKLNYLEGDIILPNSILNLSIYSNSQETLAYNGEGWYKFDEFSLNEDKYLRHIHQALEVVTANKDFHNHNKRKQEINFNDVKHNTNMHIIQVNQEGLNEISTERMKVNQLKIQTFVSKNKILVTQYETVISLQTDFDDDIVITLKGEILYDSYGEDSVNIYEPEFNKVYDNMYDFLIELLVE